MKVLKDPDCLPEIYKMLRALDLRDFNSTYSSLASLLARLRHSKTQTRAPIQLQTLPGQTTVPADPSHSAKSAYSGSSAESKPEQKMDTKLGKATMITAIDDGGISINYRRIPDDPQLSQRVVLSVEVSLRRTRYPSLPFRFPYPISLFSSLRCV